MVDTVVIKSTPQEAPADHDQKMMDKVDAANAPLPNEGAEGTQTEDRPQWLPEKFKTAEEMAKAYSELESKLGAPKPPADTPATPVADPAAATEADVEKALAPKGLNLQDFNAEFAKNGELSADSYEKLAAAGYDKGLVDQFIEGQKARSSQYDNQIMSEVGGADAYSDMVNWAKANLTPAEIDAYNAQIGSGKQESAKLAAMGLKAQFEKANGSDPQRLIGGQSGGAGAGDVFESMAQVTTAMKDPLYKSDPAYRAKVQAKLGRSNVI